MAKKLIFDEVMGAAVTQVDLDGLNIVKGELYELVMTILDNGGVSTNVRITANDDNNLTNYYNQGITANGTAIDGNRQNAPNFMAVSANAKTKIKAHIKLTNDGKLVVLSHTVRDYGSTAPLLQEYFITKTTVETSITKLSIIHPTANGIGINSRIQLYKVAEKVDEQIVSGSAVTQVDFTGLNIGKGNEYLLVSDWNVINGNLGITVNGNTSTNNYWSQLISAISTTIASQRTNYPYLASRTNGKVTLSVTKIKLANSGYFNYQSEVLREVGSSSVSLFKIYGSSTFTASLLTSISLICTEVNGVGIGSRFELYKLI